MLTPVIVAVEQSIEGEVLVRVEFYAFGNDEPVASEDFTWTGFEASRTVPRRDRHGRVRIDGEWVYPRVDGEDRPDLDRAEVVAELVSDDEWRDRILAKIRKHASIVQPGTMAKDPETADLSLLRPQPDTEALRRARTKPVGRVAT